MRNKKMERPQEMCCVHVAGSINQCKWQDKTDIENLSEEGSTSSVSFLGLWAVSCLPPPSLSFQDDLMDFYFSNYMLFQASCAELHGGGQEASVSLPRGRPWSSAPDTPTLSPAAEYGTDLHFCGFATCCLLFS